MALTWQHEKQATWYTLELPPGNEYSILTPHSLHEAVAAGRGRRDWITVADAAAAAAVAALLLPLFSTGLLSLEVDGDSIVEDESI